MTQVGDFMYEKSRPDGWGNPMWDEADVKAGGVQPGEGQLLYGLVRALKPNCILEVGTSHGYSTLHLAQACKDNGLGKVHTIEINAERQADAKKNIDLAGLSGFVYFHSEPFIHFAVDFAFLDAGHETPDLKEYLGYLPPTCKVAVVHDATYANHVVEATQGTNWQITMFPHTSTGGIAILTR